MKILTALISLFFVMSLSSKVYACDCDKAGKKDSTTHVADAKDASKKGESDKSTSCSCGASCESGKECKDCKSGADHKHNKGMSCGEGHSCSCGKDKKAKT